MLGNDRGNPRDVRKQLPHPRHYTLTKNPVVDDTREVLQGWAVVDAEDGVVLGHGLKTRTEAVIFANGCEAGMRNMGRRF